MGSNYMKSNVSYGKKSSKYMSCISHIFYFQYIERNGVTDLGRGHFSFNTKVNVGEFYEARVNGGENVSTRVKNTHTYFLYVLY